MEQQREYKKIVEPDKEKTADIFDLDQERQERREKSINNVINFREKQYEKDFSENPVSGDMLLNLKTHNSIVLNDAIDLIGKEKLSSEDSAAVIIATIMHDSGKLSSDLLSHHKKGVEYAKGLIEKMQKEKSKFEGIEITQELGQKILQAIERHMNHPFLVVKNGGERFPEPENKVDRVVYDADMLANIGFKNVGFRLASEEYLREDSQKAIENGTNALEETFANVMQGVVKLDSVVLTSPAQKIAKERIEDTKRIFNYLKENKVFESLLLEQNIVNEKIRKSGKKLNLDDKIIEEMIKKENIIKLNGEIRKAGMALGIDSKIIDKLMM